MDSEKLKKIVSLDFRVEGNKEKLLNMLCNIPPFRKYKEEEDKESVITIEKLEKVVFKLMAKYCVSIQNVGISLALEDTEGVPWYTMSFLDEENYRWLGNVYAISLYELWAKAAIKIYCEVKMRGENPLTREKLYKHREESRKKRLEKEYDEENEE